MLLPIVQAGDPVLRKVARALDRDELLSDVTQRLIADMRETMRAAPGVGLAAPQIGQSIQLAVIEDPGAASADDARARERAPVSFHVIVNPVLELIPGESPSFFEGCLSVCGYSAKVARARSVRVRAWDEHGVEREIFAQGWYARILQHEIDHLNGTLYVDRMDTRTLAAVSP